MKFLSAVGKCLPMKGIFALQRRFSLLFDSGKHGKLYASNYQPDFLYVTWEKAWAEKTSQVEFEGPLLMAPADPDGVLRHVVWRLHETAARGAAEFPPTPAWRSRFTGDGDEDSDSGGVCLQ